MLKHPLALLLVCSLYALTGCSRDRAPEAADDAQGSSAGATGDDAALSQVRAAVHALSQPETSVEYIAAEMEGAVMARTKSQALMHYDGYRVTLTTPGDRVTRITFDLIEAKPSVKQLSSVFGKPQEVRKGMLYEHDSAVTGSRIVILAQPVSMPVDEASLVRRIIIEGAHTR